MCFRSFLACCCVFSLYFLSSGLRAKGHRRGRFFSLHPWIIGLPSGNITVTSSFLNTTVNIVSQIGPTPISVFVNLGMIYPVVGHSAANFGIGSVAFTVDISTCPFAVPTLIYFAVVFS